jgi:hypothetical protein
VGIAALLSFVSRCIFVTPLVLSFTGRSEEDLPYRQACPLRNDEAAHWVDEGLLCSRASRLSAGLAAFQGRAPLAWALVWMVVHS